jgi:hypothetical protein
MDGGAMARQAGAEDCLALVSAETKALTPLAGTVEAMAVVSAECMSAGCMWC